MQASVMEIENFQPEHLDAAVELSRQAGWPHRKEDWRLVLSLSKGFVALDHGRVVGTAMATLFGDSCATVNMVIVDETMRGKGLGRKLMQAALDAAEGRECRLIATADGLPLYEKMGFVANGEVLQHQGIVKQTEKPAGVEWLASVNVTELVNLDRQAFGADRALLLVTLSNSARFAVLKRDSRVAGFASLRAFGRGDAIGPVVAAHTDDAQKLIAFILSEKAGAFVRLDTTADTALGPWLTELGLAHVGGGIPMRRAPPATTTDRTYKTFALTSQALG